MPDRFTLRWVLLLSLADVGAWLDAALLVRMGYPVTAGVCAYAAVSLLAVIVLYLWAAWGHNPGPYLKGRRAPWLQPLFLPYRVVAWLVLALARVIWAHTPSISAIGDGLYVGVRLYHLEAARLERLGVFRVVDLCAELPTNLRHDRSPYERFELPVLDRCPPAPAELARAADWVASQLASGHAVYVHCAFGRGRSALVAAAALLRSGRASSPEHAIELLKRGRPRVRLNSTQRAALDAYAHALQAGGDGRRNAETQRHGDAEE